MGETVITFISYEPPPRKITIDNVDMSLTIAETTNMIPENKDSVNLKVLVELKKIVIVNSDA